jgi:hypothetical protein
VATDANKVASADDIEGTLRHMQEMTRIAEHEMHAVVLSCKRARRDRLASLPARKPTPIAGGTGGTGSANVPGRDFKRMSINRQPRSL